MEVDKGNGKWCLYLPCLYPDTIHCVMHNDVFDGDIRDTGFSVIFS